METVGVILGRLHQKSAAHFRRARPHCLHGVSDEILNVAQRASRECSSNRAALCRCVCTGMYFKFEKYTTEPGDIAAGKLAATPAVVR